MATGTVAFVCTPETGHFRRLRGVIAGVVAAGWDAAVFSDGGFRDEVEAAGGRLIDLYEKYPLDAADAESQPISLRHTSHAGCFAEEVASELASVEPSLVVYDSFAVVGKVAARLLSLPHACVLSGHNPNPERFRAMLDRDPRVRISAACRDAVARLRERFGLRDASPFSYVDTQSPHLNLYGEPPEYLDEAARAAFEPLAFFGSLAGLEASAPAASPFGEGDGPRLYVSFGTVIWRYYAEAAIGALQAIAEAVRRRPDVRALVSLGRGISGIPRLDASNLRVADYVEQWRVLQEADLFCTHHGLNSTHEAAYWGVPMISYPFFWDQPALAARCAELGLAVPLAREPRAAISAADVDAAWDEVDRRREAMQVSFRAARAWEERVVAGRADVIRRLLALATPRS